MGEDNKNNTKDIKEDKNVEEKSTDFKVEKESKKKKEDETKNQPENNNLEDLPEDVKKKLEKRQAEKSHQKGKKGKNRKKKKKKEVKKVSVGKVYIKATYNNTIVTLTDLSGNVISWASAGIAGFRGPKKSTPYAAQIITRIAVGKAKEVGLSEVSVFVKGVGTGRESAIRALNANGLIVTSIKDITSIPHNGCRKRKPRRV